MGLCCLMRLFTPPEVRKMEEPVCLGINPYDLGHKAFLSQLGLWITLASVGSSTHHSQEAQVTGAISRASRWQLLLHLSKHIQRLGSYAAPPSSFLGVVKHSAFISEVPKATLRKCIAPVRVPEGHYHTQLQEEGELGL